MRRTTFVTLLCIVTLCGLGFARTGIAIHSSWFLVGLLILGTILITRRGKHNKIPFLIGGLVMAFLVGWLKGSTTYVELKKYDDLSGDIVVIEGISLEDAVYSERGQLTFVAGNLFVEEPYRTNLIGELDIEGSGTPAVYKGDTLKLEGKLFKKRGGQQGGISFAKISVSSRGGTKVDEVRREFAAGMQNSLPEPLASFALGLLIGQRNTLDDELTQQLIAVGLIHIVAVSGYNLTVIIHGSQKLFAKKSRYQSLVVSLILIGLFLLMTGNSPSIVRAAIVSTLSLLAWYFGRKFKPVLLLSIVAVATALANPLYLWSNIGWYLSFSAFFGILVLGPLLNKRFVKEKNREKLAQVILCETIAAQLLTLPIILYVFGRLSVVSILANSLVVPLVPMAMLFSLFAGISGMIGFVFGTIVALPAKIILQYMLSVSSILSKLPGAYIEFSINLYGLIFSYGIILVFILLLHHKTKNMHDTITE